MKKLLLAACALSLLIVPSFAGNLDVSGRAGVYNAPGGTTSMMYGLGATYGITPNLSVRGMVETTSYTSGGNNVTYMPVSLDLIYSQPLPGGISPYLGAGVSYNSTSTNGTSTQTAGGQAEVGVSYNLGGFSAGVELRYMVADFNNMSQGASTYNAYATGAFSQSFNI